MYALPVKINGVETSYEKEGHYVWGDTTTDMTIMTIIAMAIVLIHFVLYISNRKVRCMTKKGIAFWKLWRCGANMFHLLLLVCVWIPVQSLRMGYMVGGALCVLYGIGEVCRYLYLLEKRGDECNQPNRRLGETITIFREDEQLQRIQFQALDNLTFYRYCEYKYAKKKRERNWNVVWWEILWSASILVGVLLVDWKKQIFTEFCAPILK